MSEVRYAIIIGIDDYDDRPLNYCSKDAIAIKEMLVEKCDFEEENIELITSNKEKKETELTGKYSMALRKIGKKFRKDIDSILFFFAGHGGVDGKESTINFNDVKYKISGIFEEVSSLGPKMQSYIIDACHSGGKVLTRSNEFTQNDYIESAGGVFILYACEQSQFAAENQDLQHGELTNLILEAVNNENLYDKDGYLTLNTISNHVSKELVKSSFSNQVPVIENRNTGYYPFAISKLNKEIINDVNDKLIKENSEIKNRSYTKETRLKLQSECSKKVDLILERIKFDGYDVEDYNKSLDFKNLQGVDEIKETIIDYSIDNNIKSLRNLLSKIEYDNPKKKGSLSSLFVAFSGEIIPDTIVEYNIDFQDEYISSKFKIFKSHDIRQVSFGIGYIVYQGKWGLVLLNISFLIDWDGENDTEIRDITINSKGFILEEESIEKIQDISDESIFISEIKEKWDIEREREIEEFNSIT